MVEQVDWITSIQTIIEKMQTTGVAQLEVRRGKLRIMLRRNPHSTIPSVLTAGTEVTAGPEQAGLYRVVAPLTGVFYRAPNPNSKPFVDVGDWLEQDTTIGLIETMKVFNEVTADCRGRVVAFLVEAGTLVRAGDPLLEVDCETASESGEVIP
ncbi:MAG: acetyl-CoA carboxylase [Chloroflexota bacterium]|jgi:acetyl-CoA carboxylase biotin carboxyl carrier protein